MREETAMAETRVRPNLGLFEPDDDYFNEAGNLGLHLGVLSRLARFARQAGVESPVLARLASP
jgi:hypothetical protein